MWPILLTVRTPSGPLQVHSFGLCVLLAFTLPFLQVAAGRTWLNPWRVGDVLAPAWMLGEALLGMACFLAGCCPGTAVGSGTWVAVVPHLFPNGELQVSTQFPFVATVVRTGPAAGILSYPTALWTMVALLAAWAALGWFRRRRRFDGQVLATFLVVEPVIRVGIEGFRGHTGVVPIHLADLAMIAAGCVIWGIRRRTERAPDPVAEDPFDPSLTGVT